VRVDNNRPARCALRTWQWSTKLLPGKLCHDERGQNQALSIPRQQSPQQPGSEQTMQEPREPDVPAQLRVQEPEPCVDGRNAYTCDVKPLAPAEGVADQPENERQATEVE
jgi:hypothetical protein